MNLNIEIKSELTLKQGAILAQALGGTFTVDKDTGDLSFRQGNSSMGESLNKVRFTSDTPSLVTNSERQLK